MPLWVVWIWILLQLSLRWLHSLWVCVCVCGVKLAYVTKRWLSQPWLCYFRVGCIFVERRQHIYSGIVCKVKVVYHFHGVEEKFGNSHLYLAFSSCICCVDWLDVFLVLCIYFSGVSVLLALSFLNHFYFLDLKVFYAIVSWVLYSVFSRTQLLVIFLGRNSDIYRVPLHRL